MEGGPGSYCSRRAEVAAYEKLIAELRELNREVLAVAAELSRGTIETVLAKSDLPGRRHPGVSDQRASQFRRLGPSRS